MRFMAASRSGWAQVMLWGTFAIFALVLVGLVTRSLLPHDAAEYAPTPIAVAAVPDTLFVDTITVDARDAERWAFVDLERRTAVVPPDTVGWDLAFRRFEIVTSGAAVATSAGFMDLTEAPDSAYVTTTFGRDTTNAAFEDWYRYSFTSHLLNPRPNTYVIRSSAGRYAKIRLLGYYCPEMAAGCVTFQYAYQPDGSRLLRTGG
jgi:hypothetical protein